MVLLFPDSYIPQDALADVAVCLEAARLLISCIVAVSLRQCYVVQDFFYFNFSAILYA
jgi:hypothetical protein